MIPHEVFLSHSSRDRKVATRIARALSRHGIRHFYTAAHLRGAAEWHDEIGRALGRCDWFIVLLSPDAIKSVWVKRELLYVLEKARYRKRIVPVVIRSCDPEPLSWTLAQIQQVSFVGGFERGCRELLGVWGVEYVRGPGKAKSRPRKR